VSREQSNTLDLRKQCENKLGIDFREGKDPSGWFKFGGKDTCRITIPGGRKPLKAGTFGNMARQLNISAAKLEELLDCPLDLAGYIAELRKRGTIPDKPAASKAPPEQPKKSKKKSRKRGRGR